MVGEYVLINKENDFKADKISERIKELRLYHELSQTEMAEMVGVTYTTIISYEKKQKKPSIDVAAKIAYTFNVSLDWLCGITNTKTRIWDVTAADLIKRIISLTNAHNSASANVTPDIVGGDFWGNSLNISIGNAEVITYFSEYERMSELLENGTIDKELFDMWHDRQIAKHDNGDNVFDVYKKQKNIKPVAISSKTPAHDEFPF